MISFKSYNFRTKINKKKEKHKTHPFLEKNYEEKQEEEEEEKSERENEERRTMKYERDIKTMAIM